MWGAWDINFSQATFRRFSTHGFPNRGRCTAKLSPVESIHNPQHWACPRSQRPRLWYYPRGKGHGEHCELWIAVAFDFILMDFVTSLPLQSGCAHVGTVRQVWHLQENILIILLINQPFCCRSKLFLAQPFWLSQCSDAPLAGAPGVPGHLVPNWWLFRKLVESAEEGWWFLCVSLNTDHQKYIHESQPLG